MKKNIQKLNNQKGFTLIEVIVAMAIFMIIMGGSAGVFASAFKSYKSAKNVNENLKNAQYAMNLMTKTFRTSSIKHPPSANTTATLVVYDYSQSSCIRYRFSGGDLLRSNASVTEVNCVSGAAFGTETTMTSGTVLGAFNSIPSEGDDTNNTSTTVGKVTVMMHITSGSGSSSASSARIQSTSSLRDYTVSNVGIDFINPL